VAKSAHDEADSGTPPGWRAWFGAGRPWPVLVAALAGVLLSFWGAWRSLELKGFDVLTVLTAPGEASLPITLIAIDEESMGAMGQQWPWSRGTHAKLLEKLKEAGVSLVAFDVVFSEPSRDPAEDAVFAKAIKDFGAPVVLAAALEYRETAHARQWVRADPIKLFRDAGAVTGLASVQTDPDGVLRRMPVSQGAFWLAVVTAFDRANPGIARNLSVTENDRLRYLGGPQTFTTIPYHRLLDPEKLLSPNWKEVLEGNIVFVGRVISTAPELNLVEQDMFFTPFTASTGQLTPGVETQATMVANMITGESRREAPRAYGIALVLVAALAAGLAMRPWHPWKSGAIVLAIAAGVAGLSYALFRWQGLWVPGGAAVATLALAYVSEGSRSYLGEQARRLALRRAFATYVSPTLVDEILADPSKLKLGGVRLEITIVFTDLAGFTGVSEKLPAEQVAALLNRHLAEMTDIVISHGGTVDKFIGDAVMALWGAPLPDPKQSEHALAAAIEMQRATAKFAAELASTGGPVLRMRVGLHRGECIVGNLGGHNRFEYTAIGDAVNLASRLEGVNNVYGTGILASDAVASASGMRLRRVDAVRVKGRHQAVELFTPCADPVLLERSEKALEAYRAGRWDEARELWDALARDYPDDAVAKVFAARIAAWSSAGWPTPWDGVTTLESK
jgi:adenylate cyclase